ncbi:Zinc finger, BED-type [Dillenia turbinata]|uniref:Zinc finger, BED-type n=1 Tax=Dillenia turbinata TaxID=194707 RepID=A0AAN8ZHH2_9MAGN
MEITRESVLKKPKRLTSVVWNHFERVKKNDNCYAVCIHCTKKLTRSSNSGTTHLWNHLMRCLRRSNFDISQLLVKKRKKENPHSITNINADEEPRNEENIVRPSFKYEPEPKIEEVISLGSARFEQERSRFDLTRMIILHGYPVSMVDHVGFKIFVKNLQPLFDPMIKSALEDDCMLIYVKEKQKVCEMIKKFHGRTSLAVDLWTSPENARYLCLTAHYIDEDWKLQMKKLNFITINSSRTEEDMLSEGIMKSLMDWDIEQKLFSMTCGDSSTKDDVVYRIKDRLSQARPLLSNGQFFDVQCAAHVLNLLVQDAMDTLKEVTHKIRETIRYVKSSQMMQGKFNEIAQQAGVESGKSLLLDTPDHWNSTHLMLETALEYKAAFSQLQESDTACTMVPSDEEWEWSSSITSYLKLFVEITNVFTGNKCPTANLELFNEYTISSSSSGDCGSGNSLSNSSRDQLKSFDKFLHETSQSQSIVVKPALEPDCSCSTSVNWKLVRMPRFCWENLESKQPHHALPCHLNGKISYPLEDRVFVQPGVVQTGEALAPYKVLVSIALEWGPALQDRPPSDYFLGSYILNTRSNVLRSWNPSNLQVGPGGVWPPKGAKLLEKGR